MAYPARLPSRKIVILLRRSGEGTVIVSMKDGEPAPAPIFFLSYAHMDHRENRDEIRFFEALSTHVHELTGSLSGSIVGFMDKTAMRGGERWSPALLEAVGTCHVFVPLLSMSYLRSRWCAIEWEAFARRPVTPRNTDVPASGTAILPVLWSPIRDEKLIHDDVRAVQRFVPHDLGDRVVAAYERDGIYGLRGRRSTMYHAVAWMLALRIADVFFSYEVKPGVVAERDFPRPLWGDES